MMRACVTASFLRILDFFCWILLNKFSGYLCSLSIKREGFDVHRHELRASISSTRERRVISILLRIFLSLWFVYFVMLSDGLEVGSLSWEGEKVYSIDSVNFSSLFSRRPSDRRFLLFFSFSHRFNPQKRERAFPSATTSQWWFIGGSTLIYFHQIS